MRPVSLALVAVAGLLAAPASHADPLVFMFSFSNVNGNIGGTVTGEIFGLIDNATGPATTVVLDSYPAGLGLAPPPLTVSASITSNSFTVTNDVITAASFVGGGSFVLELDHAGSGNQLENFSNTNEVFNAGGFAGATYSLVQPVPEPASLAIFGTALAGLGLFRRRRRKNV